MTVTTFDTLKFARKLKDAGVSDQQAEAEAAAAAARMLLGHSTEAQTRTYINLKTAVSSRKSAPALDVPNCSF